MKLQIEQVSDKDKGMYKLVAKNDKGEATSQTVELTEIVEEKEEKIQKIQIVETLRATVSHEIVILLKAILIFAYHYNTVKLFLPLL